jgi:hypothetical protein
VNVDIKSGIAFRYLVLIHSLHYNIVDLISTAPLARVLLIKMLSLDIKILIFILSIWNLLYLHSIAAETTVSICQTDPFRALRQCAAYCISWGTPDGHCDFISYRLSCSPFGGSFHDARNDCFCRADLVSDAHSIISSCVYSQCSSNTVDYQQVMSVYDNYCIGAGKLSLKIFTFHISRRCNTD